MEKVLSKKLHNHFVPILLLVLGMSFFAYAVSYFSINLSSTSPVSRVFFTADFKLSQNNNGSYSIVPNNQNGVTYQPNYLTLGQNTILQASLIR